MTALQDLKGILKGKKLPANLNSGVPDLARWLKDNNLEQGMEKLVDDEWDLKTLMKKANGMDEERWDNAFAKTIKSSAKRSALYHALVEEFDRRAI